MNSGLIARHWKLFSDRVLARPDLKVEWVAKCAFYSGADAVAFQVSLLVEHLAEPSADRAEFEESLKELVELLDGFKQELREFNTAAGGVSGVAGA